LAQSSKDAYCKDDNDGRGKYATVSLQKPKNPGPETTYDYVDNSGKVWPCPPKGWRMVNKKIKALENDNRLYFEGDTLRVKDYWNERKNPGKRIDTLWNDLPENSSASKELEKIFMERELFDNPKPTELIKRCFDIGPKNAIVLDFFAGSGTAGQAALELNNSDGGTREFILIQNNELTDKNPNGIAYDITTKRLKRVMTGSCYDGTNSFDWIKDHAPLGDNLEVYEIAEVANFEAAEGKTPFDVIDETLYGVDKFTTIQRKIEWVCDNFEVTQRQLEGN
jgi:adenine-specific DNA-methyltransferase